MKPWPRDLLAERLSVIATLVMLILAIRRRKETIFSI